MGKATRVWSLPRNLGGALVLAGGLGLPAIVPASAQTVPHLTGPDKYHITDAERAACQGDAVMLCSNAYPDEDKLLECMRLNHANLSSVCQPVFDAGMKRRHIPL